MFSEDVVLLTDMFFNLKCFKFPRVSFDGKFNFQKIIVYHKVI